MAEKKRVAVEKEAGEDERKVVDTYYCWPQCGAGAGTGEHDMDEGKVGGRYS